jgi:hypothetical protein
LEDPFRHLRENLFTVPNDERRISRPVFEEHVEGIIGAILRSDANALACTLDDACEKGELRTVALPVLFECSRGDH